MNVKDDLPSTKFWHFHDHHYLKSSDLDPFLEFLAMICTKIALFGEMFICGTKRIYNMMNLGGVQVSYSLLFMGSC